MKIKLLIFSVLLVMVSACGDDSESVSLKNDSDATIQTNDDSTDENGPVNDSDEAEPVEYPKSEGKCGEGAVVPNLTYLDAGWKEHSFSELHTKKKAILFILSDLLCGGCQELAGKLPAIAQQFGDDLAILQILTDAKMKEQLWKWNSDFGNGGSYSVGPAGVSLECFEKENDLGNPFMFVIDGSSMKVYSISGADLESAKEAIGDLIQ